MKKFLLAMVILARANFFYAQVLQSTRFVQGSISDGQKLMQAYLWPVEKSFTR